MADVKTLRHEALEQFLREVNARSMWGHHLRTSYVEGYIANGRFFIVQRYDTDGWDILIPASTSGKIEPTLAAVRTYLESQP